MVDGGVDEVDAPDQVVLVVEALDEMAQALGGVCGEVEDILEAVPLEQRLDQGIVCDTAANKRGRRIDVFLKASAQVVQYDHPMSHAEQLVHYVRADEPCPTRY